MDAATKTEENGLQPPAKDDSLTASFLFDVQRLAELQSDIVTETGHIAARLTTIEDVIELRMKEIRHRRERMKEMMREARAIALRLQQIAEFVGE